MKISFSKVGATPGKIAFVSEGVSIEGSISRTDQHLIKMISKVKGEIILFCDRCGKEFSENIDYDLNLYLSDMDSSNMKDLDTIECTDGVIDLSQILESEINLHRLMYNYCPDCKDSDSDVDIEY